MPPTITRSARATLTGLLLAALLALGCQLMTGLAGEGGALARYGVERREALVLAGGQPDTLDPARTLDGPAGVVGHIFGGLVRLDPDLRLEPHLAAGWSLSPDERTYTFHLRRDAVFHDGRPLTARDVIFSWERALDPATGSDTALTYLGAIDGAGEMASGAAAGVRGLERVDDHTVRVRLVAPTVSFLARLTMPVAMVVDETNVSRPDWERAPNGTGPFRLVAWEDDEIIVLARHEGAFEAPPPLAHVVVRMAAGIPLSLFENGEIDLVRVGGSTLERLRDPNNPLSARLQTGVAFCTQFIGFDASRPPFDDARVRRAFTLALDRPGLVRTLAQGSALPANGPLPPGMPGYLQPEGLPFDVAAARQLLAEAGYEGAGSLPPLTFVTGGSGDPGPLVTAVVTYWQENLGVTVTPTLADPFTYGESLYDGVGNLYTFGWCADYPDPDNFLDVLFGSGSPQNFGRFSDADLDTLLAEAAGEADTARRLALYADAERRLIDAAPAIFISHSLDAVLVQPDVRGYRLTPIGVPQWQRLSRP